MRIHFGPVLLLLCMLTASTASLGHAHPVEPGPEFPSTKIAPWVIEHTANGAQAEFLIVLGDQAELRGANAFQDKIGKARYVRDALWNKAQSTQKPLLEWLAARNVEYRSYYIVNLIWAKGDRNLALALAARPDVARIEGNPKISNLQSPIPNLALAVGSSVLGISDSVEPNIAYVHAPEVWAMGFTGQGIVVGGQDTGYQWDHPALKPHYRGWDGAAASHDYNWHDSIHTGGSVCGANSPQPCDDYGHGTHTMGTAVGSDGANQIGMAPGAKWIGCRNMNVGVGTPATYLECFEFFLAPYPVNGTPAQGDPTKAPDVTVNSWTCPTAEGCSWNTLQAAIEAQRAAGIMTEVSAGNGGAACSSVQEPPALYDAAYTVGALNTGYDTLALFSSRGPVTIDGSHRLKPDITAPGTGICSSVPVNSYSCNYSGTSMAGPHVAGAVALLWSADPMLRNQVTLTEQILNGSAVHIVDATCDLPGTTWPNNTFGYGRLDAKAAVMTVMGTLTGVTSASDSGLPLSTVVQASNSWTTTQIAASAAGQYTFTLSAGSYTITATYNGYGYYPKRITNVQVLSQTTTTQNLALTPYEHFVVSGVISDAVSGAPLSGAVLFSGPISISTVSASPSNGFYSTTVMSGTYVLRAAAPYHARATRTVTVHGDQTQNFALQPGDPPEADFGFSYPAMMGHPVIFTNTTTGTMPISYRWDFGDGVTSTLENPAHTYMRYGLYTTTLDAFSDYGTDRYTKTLTVTALFVYLPSVKSALVPTQLLDAQEPSANDEPTLVRVNFQGADDLNQLAKWLDIWEVNHQAGYLLAMVTPDQQNALAASGYTVQVDSDKTQLLRQQRTALPGQTSGIPGYPCYRTVEETQSSLQLLATTYPTLTELVDIGDSWDKTTPGGNPGYDLWDMVITNKAVPGPKSRFFLMAEVHAREYTTAETATRFAEYLLQNYGKDPNVTWMVDYHEIHIVPMSNPDGRKFAEEGILWRKNTDSANGCAYPNYGVDLNRNSSFHWGGAGTSSCDETYQGPSVASEPEVQALQNRVLALFPDQRGPNDSDPAPADATGVFITLHSFSELVLFPWSWSATAAPNAVQLQTLGRKFGYFNRYTVCQSPTPGCLYAASGTNDDWAYGQLGLAAYTFEMGTDFFQACNLFENTIYPRNLAALLYAARVARTPYTTPAGPDVLTPTLSLTSTLVSTPITLTATANSTRYFSNGWGNEPVRNIAGAEYTIDTPPWVSGTLTHTLSAADGNFDGDIEGLAAVISSIVAPGRHTIYVRAQSAEGNWGPVSATFWWVAAISSRVYLPSIAK